jgi:hypothetical protein
VYVNDSTGIPDFTAVQLGKARKFGEIYIVFIFRVENASIQQETRANRCYFNPI